MKCPTCKIDAPDSHFYCPKCRTELIRPVDAAAASVATHRYSRLHRFAWDSMQIICFIFTLVFSVGAFRQVQRGKTVLAGNVSSGVSVNESRELNERTESPKKIKAQRKALR